MSADPTRYRFDKATNAPALRDELLAAGIPVAGVRPVFQGSGSTAVRVATDLDLDPADYDRAAAVVAMHDQAARDAADQTGTTALRDAKATLRTYYVQSPATITNAQSVAAIKALIVVVRALAQIDQPG